MNVEIWSDVMCPFCYIGKRRFEKALEKFDGRNEVRVVWKSYQLNPDLITDPSRNINEYLAEHKGISLEEAKALNDRVTAMAREVGLIYDFDKTVVANSFDAHRLSHFAKRYGRQDAMEERLFRAYFTEGLNTADHGILTELATEVGLGPTEVGAVLASDEFGHEVEQDIYEAYQIGVQGVPFFLFEDKYAVSGAQSAERFVEVLDRLAREAVT